MQPIYTMTRDPHFDRIPDEIIHLIIFPLLVSSRPIEITYGKRLDPKCSVRQACSILQVSKRFHRIAEIILYQCNIFEFHNSSFWLYEFLDRASWNARSIISMLKIHWPAERREAKARLTVVASCKRLLLLEIVGFPLNFFKSDLRDLDRLQVKEVRFEKESCLCIPDLTATLFGCDGSKIRTFDTRQYKVRLSLNMRTVLIDSIGRSNLR